MDAGQSAVQVWSAVDLRLDSRVIIKKFGVDSDMRAAALEYGAERDALVRSLPFVPRLRDTFQTADGVLYLVRDEVPGRSLRKIVEQDGPMRYDRACRAARAAALIAHRFHIDEPHPLALGDLQAANFIVEDDDILWFVGGGSTSVLSRDRGHWSPVQLSRFAYAAPELPSGATVRSDVWGIGALLFYLLTGAPPPADGADSVLTQLYDLVPALPDEIGHFLREAMATDPEERFDSAEVVADGLRVLSMVQPPAPRQASIPKMPPLALRKITISESPVVHSLRRGDSHSLAWAKLSNQSANLRTAIHSSELTALPTLDIVPFAHQLETAKRVLTTPTMSGGAILADEVGLGKTIEALIVLQELRARQLAENTLIVAQPQGVLTWEEETHSRIRSSAYESGFRIYENPSDAGYPLLIVSAATLRIAKHRQALASKRYDLVIADEAHTLTGADGKPNALGRAIASLSRRRVLLLTATPVRRRLRELYTLVSIIRPGFFGMMEEFVERFEAPTDRADAERRALRAVLDGIMVRHRRRELPDLAFPTRSYRTLAFSATRSSNVAAGKSRALLEYIHRAAAGKRLVLFSSNQAERLALVHTLQRALTDRKVYLFGGDRNARRNVSRAFRDSTGAILVAGDNGTEGMNWQSAEVVVHCDIPWSPSIWEQRVGRVYRLGQRGSHVEIVHLVMPGSRDEAVLGLYEHAMGLFDLAIGEVASLLDYLPDPQDRDVHVRLERAFKDAGIRHGFQGGNAAYASLGRYRKALGDARRQYAAECEQSDVLDMMFGLSA
jgi:serine/threonine protein kinase